MKYFVFFALLSVAAAKPKPGGLLSGWGGGLSSLDLVHQPAISIAQPSYTIAQPSYTIAQPVVHAAPVLQAAPIAVAKQATSYSSFQRIVHPVAVAQPVVQAVAQPVVQAVAQPVVQAVAQPVVHAAPVVQTIAQPVVQKYLSLGSYGHGW